VVEAFTWDILPDYTGQTALQTLKLLGNLSVASGGFKRNDNDMSDYDNNEWILIDLRMSDAYRRSGQASNADKVLGLVVNKAGANFNLLPELYNEVPANGSIGAYYGSIPMVGYGGGMFILTLLDRAGLFEPYDCGQSVLTDGGLVNTSDGGPTHPGGGAIGTGTLVPRTTACLCQGVAQRAGAAPSPATAALLMLPYLLLTLGLGRRRRGSRPSSAGSGRPA
jgi:hypothetical protein